MISDQAVGLAGIVLSATPRNTLNVVDLVYNPDINAHGHYTFALPDLGEQRRRPLRDPGQLDE